MEAQRAANACAPLRSASNASYCALAMGYLLLCWHDTASTVRGYRRRWTDSRLGDSENSASHASEHAGTVGSGSASAFDVGSSDARELDLGDTSRGRTLLVWTRAILARLSRRCADSSARVCSHLLPVCTDASLCGWYGHLEGILQVMTSVTVRALASFPDELEAHYALIPSSHKNWRPPSWAGIPSEQLTPIEQICHVRDVEVEGYQKRFRRTLDGTQPAPRVAGHRRNGASAFICHVG